MDGKTAEIHPATVEAIEARTDTKIEKAIAYSDRKFAEAIAHSDRKFAELRQEIRDTSKNLKLWFLGTAAASFFSQLGVLIALFSLFGK